MKLISIPKKKKRRISSVPAANNASVEIDIKKTDKREATAGRASAKKKSYGLVPVFIIFFAGLSLILYPWLSNLINERNQSRAIISYDNRVQELDTEAYEKMLADAQAYNESLAYETLYNGYVFRSDSALERLSEDNADANSEEEEDVPYEDDPLYNSLLNSDGSGMMGYITIPSIDVALPIYHGTSDAVLQTGVGHIAGSSLPVGGESSHCVLSGHRGLPSARLFTDLDQIKIGNTFVLTILNEQFTYQVDQIEVVVPTDLSLLQIEEGRDLCTLVTCTPYGINTHRLLVRGTRVPNGTGDSVSEDQSANHGEDYILDEEPSHTERLRQIGPYLAAVAVALFVVLFLLTLIRGRREKKKADKREDK